MSDRKFISYSQDQDLLLLPSLRDWLPEGHLAHFISDSVDSFELSDWESAYRSKTGAGAPPFPPQMMLKVMLYGYAVGVFSSRKLARRCVEDVAFRNLAGQLSPDFRSILKFRKRHIERSQSLFVQVVEVAHESVLVKLGRVAIDGSKFKANASKHKAMSYSHMCAQEKKLQEEIAAILEQVEAVDAAEDEEFGDYHGYSLPDALAIARSALPPFWRPRLVLKNGPRNVPAKSPNVVKRKQRSGSQKETNPKNTARTLTRRPKPRNRKTSRTQTAGS